MKHTRSHLFLSVLGTVAVLLSSCSKNDSVQTVAQNTKAAAKDITADIKAVALDSWDSIKNYTHDKREDFAAGLERMAAKHDAELAALNAKLTGLPDAAAKQRDHAVKDFKEARANLKSELASLRAGTADTWAEAKESAAQSWQRVHAAFEKIKASPTS